MRTLRSMCAGLFLAAASLGMVAATPGAADAQHYRWHGGYHYPYYWHGGFASPYRAYSPYYGYYGASPYYNWSRAYPWGWYY